MNNRCDLTRGPCACGAWHDELEVARLKQEQKLLDYERRRKELDREIRSSKLSSRMLDILNKLREKMTK
jgi:hypothetical protein